MTYLSPRHSWFGSASGDDISGNPLSTMRKAFDNLFDDFGLSSGACARFAAPRMNISETESSVDIEAELPGIEEKDVELSLNKDTLTIRGEKRMERDDQNKNFSHQERAYGKFTRSIHLPFEADPKTLKALFAKGVLKVTVPKPANVIQNNVKIPIKAIA